MKNCKVFIAILVVVIAYLVADQWFSKRESPLVTCAHGALRGSVALSREAREFFEFLGIPYAKAPVGQLRYEPPELSDPWAGVLEARSFGEKCMQLDLLFQMPTGSEDCLFLNVYTPELPSSSKNVSMPVMVFFHGGAYFFGSGQMYKADYFMDQKVVLVTVNYRLNSFGFLNTGDEVVTGNMGLKDQAMSLQWLKRNIQAFGGDPSRVTIFGESAGGASAHLHLVSPASQGLFHRAISQSGSALSPWSMWAEPGRQAARFASKFGCPTEDSLALIACMRKIPANEIAAQHREILLPLRDMIKLFVPTVEGGPLKPSTFLPAHPRALFESGAFSKVPWLGGANAQDGLIFSAAIIRNETVSDLVYNNFVEYMPNILMCEREAAAAKKIQAKYIPESPRISSPESLRKLTDLFTQRSFFNGIIEAAELQTGAGAPVHLFQYSHKGEFRPSNMILAVKRKYPVILEFGAFVLQNLVNKYVLGADAPFYGVGHIDELGMLFSMPFLSHVGINHPDYQMSNAMVKLWVDFAYGRPLKLLDVNWPQVGPNAEFFKFLNISMTPETLENPFRESYQFWKSLEIASNL